MNSEELHQLTEAVLLGIEPGKLSDESIQALHRMFQNTFIAALDLIDRGSVFRYQTTWGRVTYEVRGSTSSYRVFAFEDLAILESAVKPKLTPPPIFCSCPAFGFSSILSQPPAMCKHILAVRLASRLSKFADRSRTEDELVALAQTSLEIS